MTRIFYKISFFSVSRSNTFHLQTDEILLHIRAWIAIIDFYCSPIETQQQKHLNNFIITPWPTLINQNLALEVLPVTRNFFPLLLLVFYTLAALLSYLLPSYGLTKTCCCRSQLYLLLPVYTRNQVSFIFLICLNQVIRMHKNHIHREIRWFFLSLPFLISSMYHIQIKTR